MTRSIYILHINDVVHYVGKTKNPKKREISHKYKHKTSTFEIVDEVPSSEWKFWERHYISLYRSWGFQLDNKKLYAGNGSDGYIMTDEHRRHCSEAQKRRPKIGIGNGYKHTEEQKKAKSLRQRGIPWTEARWKAYRIKYPIKALEQKKVGGWNKGIPCREETKEKLRALKGRHLNADTIIKMRLAAVERWKKRKADGYIYKPLSEAHKEKMRATIVRNRKNKKSEP